MLVTDRDNNIIFTQGDTFKYCYPIEQVLKRGDRAILSICNEKKVIAKSNIYSDRFGYDEDKTSTYLNFEISAEEMNRIPVGMYWYDVCIRYADGKRYTTDFKKKLTIVSNAHPAESSNVGCQCRKRLGSQVMNEW